ncbi:ABC transporter substrate-binding protein [Nocardiopsis sp. NPDC050513]|uniref:ABC transporter substrate-binding protein n=1 Tax=Nocardiopsis sp. NPDC050513 TaxID=3364338 RepID=UPI0037A1C8B9
MQSNVLKVGTLSPSVVLRVGRRLGLLDVEEQPQSSSPEQFRALRDGRIDAAVTSPDNVVAYRFVRDNPLGATFDARIAAPVDRGLGLGLYTRPGLAGLGGALVGVDVPDSGYAFALYRLLESHGLRPGGFRVTALGATPRRLAALLAGECDATMLNAGSELRAEDAGATRVSGVADVCGPYLGSVLATVGGRDVERLAAGLRETAERLVGGAVDALAAEEAAAALGLPGPLAERYVRRLKSPVEGLVAGGSVDMDAMRTVVDLRRRHRPDPALADALDPARGLVQARA